MVGIFKHNNTSNIFILAAYALVLKSGLFLHPSMPLLQPEDQILYRYLVNLLASIHFPAMGYSVLVFLMVWIQALLFNQACIEQRLFSRPTYLWAMSFILLTSLLPAWNQFSSALLLNFFLVWLFSRLMLMHSLEDPLSRIFNAGLILGIASLVSGPAFAFVLLLLLALYIIRPLNLREWFIALLGLATPFYFIGVYLFLKDQFQWKSLLPRMVFHLPTAPRSLFDTIGLLQIAIVFMVGGFIMQGNLNKMLIQVRKNWTLMLLYLFVAVLAVMFYGSPGLESWILCAVPLAGFHAAAYYFPEKRFFPLFLHWALFLYALLVNYWV